MTRLVQRCLAGALIVAGALALLWVAVNMVVTASYRRYYTVALESRRASASSMERVVPPLLMAGEPIGKLEIARVGLSGVVVEGDRGSVLDRAIGHLPETPLPWQRGNTVLAAHRDALFRPLKGIRSGDLLRLMTPYGDFEYRVRETLIVKPDDLWVLDTTLDSMLTLITCYPFVYIGHAPERFVVRADRIPTEYRVVRIGALPLLTSP
jgi:sortase A